MIKVNDKSPHILVPNINNSPTEIPSTTGRYTFVLFLRHSGCPWCHLTIQMLDRFKKRFEERSCKIICFIQSDRKVIEESLSLQNYINSSVNFIADPEMKYYEMFGVKPSKKSLLKIFQTTPYWLKSVYKNKNKPFTPEGSELLLIPGAFIIDNESEIVIDANYDARIYSDDAVFEILGKMA